MARITVAPQNSVVCRMDSTVGVIPETIQGLVGATESCIAVGCRMEFDGPTEIRIGPDESPADADIRAFQGYLPTPSRKLAVYSVLNEELVAVDVPADRTWVEVFVNDVSEPDRIVIHCSPPPMLLA